MDLAWMSRVCNPQSHSPLAHHPVTLEVENTAWAVATDGRVLVAVSGIAPAGFPPAPADQLRTLTGLLTPSHPGTTTDLAALRAWAEPPQWPGPDPCPQCTGTGAVRCETCDGTGLVDCVCASCEHEHEAECRACRHGQAACAACDGTGHQGGRLPVRPGWIGPALINRELLARALAQLPGETVTLAAPGPRDPLSVDSPGWRVVVMPMHDWNTAAVPAWPLAP